MNIGVPKEIKTTKTAAVTPGGVLIGKRGHAVRVQTQAGMGSGFSDEDYVEAGPIAPQ